AAIAIVDLLPQSMKDVIQLRVDQRMLQIPRPPIDWVRKIMIRHFLHEAMLSRTLDNVLSLDCDDVYAEFNKHRKERSENANEQTAKRLKRTKGSSDSSWKEPPTNNAYDEQLYHLWSVLTDAYPRISGLANFAMTTAPKHSAAEEPPVANDIDVKEDS